MSNAWPDLPVGIKNGFAVRAHDTIFAGLGIAGRAVFGLDCRNRAAGWSERAPFPGPAPGQPAVAVSGGSIYVVSGSGLETPDAVAPVVFDTVHRYDPVRDRWEKLATRAPAGLLGASATVLHDGSIAFLGGFDKAVFDRFMAEIAAIDRDRQPDLWRRKQREFMRMPPESYRWNDRLWIYRPESNEWSDLGRVPHLPNAGAALIDLGNDRSVLVSGEIKPGLRTDAARLVDLSSGTPHWSALPNLPAGHEQSRQDGVAGAFCGLVGGKLVVAGGATFPGSRAAAEAGNWFAHEGLVKAWRRDIFVFADGRWSLAGLLPRGLAYGAGVSLPEGLLLVGGEDETGSARPEVSLLTLDAGSFVACGQRL